MTDIQFKSYLKQLLARLENAKEQNDQEQIRAKIEAIMKDLREDLQS